MNKFLFLTIVSLLIHNCCFATGKGDNEDYGLLIKAAPSLNSQKTTLILENNSFLALEKETTLSFDMLIRDEYLFGIVFRIITDKQENIDLMLTANDTKRHPILVINEQAHVIPYEIIVDQWMPVSLTLSKTKKELGLTYGRNEEMFIPYDISGAGAKISFGASVFESFTSTDIASVNIKNIRIFDSGKLKRYWKLKEHKQDIVLDSVARIPATAIHPQWIIDTCSTWEKIYSNTVAFNSQVAFDGNSTFYLASPDSRNLEWFETNEKRIDSLKIKSGYIASNSPNTIFFDSLSNQLVTYNLVEAFLSAYSFETNTWNSQKKPARDPYLNHSAVYSPQDQVLYSFGGYGYHKYDHDFIRTNLSDGYQKKLELIEIPPRYSASTVIVEDAMYIFGGRGSKSGRQEIAPRNYYDFYSVNLLMGQTIQLWEETEVEEDFFPGSNMVYDRDRDCFYVFTTKGGGTLFQIETKKKGFVPVSFPIGENFDALFSYTNLYFSPSQQKLFALIYKQITKTETLVSIYSLHYPVVPIDSLKQTEEAVKPHSQNRILWLTVLFVLLSGGLWNYFRQRKNKNRVKNNLPLNTGKEPSPDKQERVEIQEKSDRYDFYKSSVCFLNGFNVINREGNNITGQFTPTLKHLLILLILYTEKDNNGIHGKKLIQFLWFDKNEESAKNNRNVYFSKLRLIFEDVGGIEIVNENGYWSIKMDEVIHCDYTETMQLFRTINENNFQDQTRINKLLELLLRGVLLPNTEIDWLDNFKSDFSNLTIDVLSKLSKEEEYRSDNDLRMKIADALFLHDPINEEALSIKCSILYHSGKKGIANSVYTNFCKEHYHLLGILYKRPLSDIIKA